MEKKSRYLNNLFNKINQIKTELILVYRIL